MAMISQLIFRCPTTLRTTMFTFRSLSTAADSDRRRWDEEYLPLFECLWKPKDPNKRHQLISYAKKMRAIRNGKYGVEITELEKQTHYETRKEVERILSEVDAAEEEESIGNLICSSKKEMRKFDYYNKQARETQTHGEEQYRVQYGLIDEKKRF